MQEHSGNARLWFVVGLIAVAALSRLLPHPPNFSPVAAVALFAGAQLAPRWLACLVPMLALLISDLVLGLHSTLPAVYLAMLLTVWLGGAACRSGRAVHIAGAVVGSALLFFSVTNLAVWWVGGLYPQTAAGLAACFGAAIPFFQNTLLGTASFAFILFGGLRLSERAVPALRAGRLGSA